MRIRNRILLAYVPIVVLVLFVTLGTTHWYASDLLFTNSEKQFNSLASAQVHRLRYIVQHQKERFALIASRTRMRKLIHDHLNAPTTDATSNILAILNDAQSSLDEFNAIGVTDPDGNWIATTDPYWFPDKMGDVPWFDDALQESGIYAFQMDEEGFPGMLIGGPVILDDEVIGTLIIHATLESITRATVDYTGLGETGETLLVMRNKHGHALFLTPTRFDPWAALKRTVSKSEVEKTVTQALLGNEGLFPNAVDYRGIPVLAVTRFIDDLDWGVVVKQDLEEVLRPLVKIRRVTFGLAIMVLPLAGLLIYLASRSLSTPITKLTRKARTFHQENVDGPLTETYANHDEVDLLGKVMEDMTAALSAEKRMLEERVHERTQELEASTNLLAETEERFRIAVEGSSDGLWDWPDVSRPEMWFSQRVYELLELEDGAIAPNIDGFGALIDPEVRASIMHRLMKLAQNGGTLQDEFLMQTGSGDRRWFALRCVCKKDERTGSYRMAGSLQDIMSAKVAEASIRKMLEDRQRQATHDPLTGMLNRRGFEERWSVEVARMNRMKSDLMILILDADHFKNVNDTWGHQVGDDVLVMLANAIRACLRETDVAARFGGEEFVVALVNTGKKAALAVANRMREYISKQETDNGAGGKLSITCSIGMTRHVEETSLETSLNLADQALYKAKESGRNLVIYKSPGKG